MPTNRNHQKDLIDLFASIESKEEAEMLLKDILTPQERDDIAERWQLIKALASGLTQREVAKKCNVSISKVTRGAHELKYGSGGFRFFLNKLDKLEQAPKCIR
ncbi:MAG: Trp family transcriptional regulator [Candidatus Peribacteraceae bacterium]|nr:Trp family transcriptional regulator [Candidatus Peribacteraceae bacterium]